MADPLPDFYEILQVSPRADGETVDRVFRHLARRFHPDNRDTGNSDRFSELVSAYRVLSDPEQRAKYDNAYSRGSEGRWRVFSQESAVNTVEADSRLRLAILSILYVARRNNVKEPGVGVIELERLLGCPEQTIAFQCWYLGENRWIERLVTGHLAITAAGVDRVYDLGGPAKLETHLLTRGENEGALAA